jgi:O-antigen ligase
VTLVVLLTFAGQLLFGANRNDLSLAFSIAWLVAVSLVLTQPWARASIERTPLAWVGGAFALVLLAGVFSLTPLFEPHPIWTLAPGAIHTVSIDPYATWLELFKLLGLAAAFLVGASFGGDDDRAKQLIQGLLLAGLAYGVWAFFNFETDRTLLFGQPRHLDPARLAASLSSANIAATLFGALVLLNIADLTRRIERQRERWASGGFKFRYLEGVLQSAAVPLIALGVSLTCLVLTLSRTGMVATLAGVVVFLGWRAVLGAKKGALAAPLIGMLAIVIGLAIAALAFSVGAVGDRVTSFHEDASSREAVYAAHWKAFLASPWQGYGLGAFKHVNGMFLNNANREEAYGIGAAHNVYLQWLEEAGLVGALPMFATVGLIAARIIRGLRERQRVRLWLLGILSVLGLFLVHGFTDFPLEVPSMSLFLSLLLGLGYRMARR